MKDERIQQFIEAVELDFKVKLNFAEAAEILKGITDYLLILEKIYVRKLNKNKLKQNDK